MIEQARIDDVPDDCGLFVRGNTMTSPLTRMLGSTDNRTTAALVASWRGLGIPIELVSHEALAALGADDTVVSRLDVCQTLDGVEPGLLALLLLERRGTRVINSAAALLGAHDKLRTARLLHSAGVPHPSTRLILRRGAKRSPIRPPVVIKPRYGSWGRHVYLCTTDTALTERLDAIGGTAWFRRHGAIVQEVVPSRGHDLRVLVANGRVVGAAERVAAPGEWRTNVTLGGSLRPAELSADAVELARTAAAAIDADLVGVDLLPTPHGYIVLELNGAVDFDQRYSLDGSDIFAETAQALDLSPPERARRHRPLTSLTTTSLSRKEPS